MFDTKENFWIVHPALTVAGPFGDLHRKDKSKNKATSSKLAWAIKLIWDRKSDYYNLPEKGLDNKIDLIFEDFYGDVTYYVKNLEKVESLRDFYFKSTETLARRTLRGIEDKLHERDLFIRNTPYDVPVGDDEIFNMGDWAKRIDTIDKMLANTDKIYTLYDKARKVVEQEESQTTMGGAQESLSDSEAI